MRTDSAKRFLGRGSRRLVAVSDTTVARSLSTYFLTPLRRYLKSIYTRASHDDKCKIDVCGRKLKAACVDGSQYGGFYGCVLQSLGVANLLLDIERTTGKGKELPKDVRKGYEYAKWTLDFLSELLLMWFYVEYHAAG